MALSNPNGEMQFWFQGMPFMGVNKAVRTGEMSAWFQGMPYMPVFRQPIIKTVNGIPIGNIKTKNGVPNTSIKTVNNINN